MNNATDSSVSQSHGQGYLALVLHAHLPYVRHLEYDDALEGRWLFEAITETYVPLLLLFDKLIEDKIDFRLTMSISPTLAAMLADPFLKSRYLKRLELLIQLSQNEIIRTKAHHEFNELALFYQQYLMKVHDAFLNRYDKNLVQAFKRLQDLGKVEIIASAATHGYLPLLAANSSAVRAQVRIGIKHYQQLFDRNPKGFWLPELGYCSELDKLLAEQSIGYTILETHGVTRSKPRPEYGGYAPISCPAGTIAFGRDPDASRQVWSTEGGYPGDYDYREFYRDIAYDLDYEYIRPYIHHDNIRTDTGFKYYRITGNTDQKAIYVPEVARQKAVQHAEHFIASRLKQIDYLNAVMDRPPIIVAPYDAELFGHWWFEGPIWLDSLIRQVSQQQDKISLVTLSEYLDEYPENQTVSPSASSWGHNGSHETWLNERNDWIYPHLHHGAQVMERLARNHPQAEGLTLRALKQAARELLLAQASDWAFMINSGKMSDYATRRTNTHLMQFRRLEREIDNQSIDERWLTMIEYRNNIFPHIDYRAFC